MNTEAEGSGSVSRARRRFEPDERVQSEDEFASFISLFIGAIRRHVWLALAICAVGVFGATAYGLSQTKIYRARATVQIDPQPPSPLGKGVEEVVHLGTGNYWANMEYYNTQHRLLKSKPVALSAVRSLGLHRDTAFLANEVGNPEHGRQTTEDQAARAVMARLTVTPAKDSRLVEVAFDDADRKRGVRILEAVLRAYLAHNLDRTMESNSAAVDWLQEQLDSLRSDLSKSELALHEYKLDKEIASIGLDGQATLLAREMEDLNATRTQVQAKIQKARARVAQLERISPTDPSAIPQTELLQSSELAELRSEYVENLRHRDSLLAEGKGSRHPQVLAATARVEATRGSLASEIHNIQTGARQELSALEDEAGGLTALLKSAEEAALELNLMEIEYSRLKRTKDNNEKLYSLVLERSKEAGLTQMLRVNNIHILSPPETANAPVKPRMSLILSAGLLLGLGLGIAAAFVRDRLDRTVRTPQDLQTRMGLTPLGVIPETTDGNISTTRKRRRRSGSEALEHMVHAQPTSGFAEAFRTVRTNLLFMSPDSPFRRLLVTSPGPAEGKTTVACSLAIAMAHAGRRVILVDCDMRRPRMHTVFGRAAGEGTTVSESLLNPSQLDNRKPLETNIANLSVLPAGPTPPNPSELLHSQAFGKLLDDLSARYDMVILDSPPLVVTDAAIISARVDGAILVVRANQTDRYAASQAVRSLRDVGGLVIGAVLNAMSATKAGYGYGYGSYGYAAEPPSNGVPAQDSP